MHTKKNIPSCPCWQFLESKCTKTVLAVFKRTPKMGELHFANFEIFHVYVSANCSITFPLFTCNLPVVNDTESGIVIVFVPFKFGMPL
jgi:hypothetical protein